VDRVTVSPSSAITSVGGTVPLQATALARDGRPLQTSFTWSSQNTSIATVSPAGVVSAVAAGSVGITAAAGGKSGAATITVTAPPTGMVIDVIPTVTFQTMTGWEGVAQIGQVECDRTAWPLYRTEIVDRLVNEMGINRVRIGIRSGAENPTDWFTQRYFTNQIDEAVFRTKRYNIVNDNADPFSVNPAGFWFTELDNTVDEVINPMRQRLAARGERLYVNFTYVDFDSTPFEHASNPEEYAEFMLVMFQHLNSKYGWTPDAVEMILEPDNTPNWRPGTIGPALVAAGDRLKAAGFRPAFIAPSSMNAAVAVQYFDALMQIPRVTEYLTDLGYHRYAGVSPQVIASIGQRAATWGIRTSMLELIGSDYNVLHEDLEQGLNSAWEQFGLAGCNTGDRPGLYYTIDVTNPSQPQINLGSRGKLLRQYFLYIRLGAVRIGALSGDQRLAPLAFRNTNGKFVVVVKAETAASFQVRHLPAGTYGITYATASQYDVHLSDVTVSGAGTMSTSIPAAGVITIFQR
jgi:hypothetical protein